MGLVTCQGSNITVDTMISKESMLFFRVDGSNLMRISSVGRQATKSDRRNVDVGQMSCSGLHTEKPRA